MALYEKVFAANALYNKDPKKVKGVVDAVFEEEKLRLEGDKDSIDNRILELDKEKSELMRFVKDVPATELDLFQKIDYAKTIYTGNHAGLSDAVKEIFEECGIEKKDYSQALENLCNEKNKFLKHTIFRGKDPEYNARVEEMEKALGVSLSAMKTSSYLQKWNPVRIFFYSIFSFLGVTTPSMGIYKGLAVCLGLSLLGDVIIFNIEDRDRELKQSSLAMSRAEKLDSFMEK